MRILLVDSGKVPSGKWKAIKWKVRVGKKWKAVKCLGESAGGWLFG